MMRAISLWQPWAAAMRQGQKKVETRGFKAKVLCLYAIQSALVWEKEQREAARMLALLAGKHEDYFMDRGTPANQRGAVLCVARLNRVEVITNELIDQAPALERAFGNWKPGRCAWFFEDSHPLSEPYPLKGQQGIWTLPLADEAAILGRAGL